MNYAGLLLALLFLSVNVCAQQISGVVQDGAGKPIPGVTLKNLSTHLTTQTDQKGTFQLAGEKGQVVEASMVGYESSRLTIGSEAVLKFQITEKLSSLEETVVIGYQTVTRKKNTAAMSTISGKELENIPAASFESILQGRLPGVNVQNISGSPGSMGTVYVRGSTGLSNNFDEAQILSSPLYVVDGVPQPTEQYTNLNTGTGTNFLAGINPNDIESVSVLRDASAAAIYGSRAANGVILITTKKGTQREPVVVVSGYSGLTMRPDLRPVALGAAERRQKMEIVRNQLSYAEQINLPFLLTDSLNPAFNGNTNFQDLFYQKGLVNNADLSLSGSSGENSSYRFSANYYDEDGIIKATGFRRLSTRLNLINRALNNKITINPIIAYTNMDRARGNGNGVSPLPLGSRDMPSSLFELSDARKAFYTGLYDENLDKNLTNQLTFNLNLDIKLLPKLTLTSQTAYQYNTGRRDMSRPSALNNNLGNSAYAWNSAQQNWLSSNYLNYNDTFGKHSLTMLVGQDIVHDTYQESSAEGWKGNSDQIQVVQGFLRNYTTAYSDYQAWGLLSYYSRVSYDYDSRYIFSGSIRTDGSSRFGKNNRFGWFPSASAAWLISEENFMEDNENFSLLKLRASYGTTGNLPRENYLSYNTYRLNAGTYSGANAPSYNGIVAITPNFVSGVAQDNLTWEKGMSWNIGTDIELFNGKYSLSADIYNKETNNQLFAVQLPINTGYDFATTNSVGVRNYGAELVIGMNPLSSSSPVNWRSNFNISYNKNQIMKLPNGGRDLVMNGDRFDASHILSIGSPINAFYLFQNLGVYSTINDVPVNPYTGGLFGNGGPYGAGMFHLKDLDGDYYIDSFRDGINPDKLPMGDPNPKWTGGWNNVLSYKNFSLSFLINFTLDRDVLNLFEADAFATVFNNEQFARKSYPDLDRYNIWKQDGDKAEYAKLDMGSYRYYYTSSQTFFLEPGSYIRLQNIILNYSLNQAFASRIGIKGARVYGLVQNVASWQASRKIPDAESINQYGEYSGNGYPIPRKFTVGLEVTF